MAEGCGFERNGGGSSKEECNYLNTGSRDPAVEMSAGSVSTGNLTHLHNLGLQSDASIKSLLSTCQEWPAHYVSCMHLTMQHHVIVTGCMCIGSSVHFCIHCVPIRALHTHVCVCMHARMCACIHTCIHTCVCL